MTPIDLTYEEFEAYCEGFIKQAWVDLCLENVCQWQLEIVKGIENHVQAWTTIRQYHPNIMIHIAQDKCATFDDVRSYLQHELGHCLAFQYSQFYLIYAKGKEMEFNLVDEAFSNRLEKIVSMCGLGEKWHKSGLDNVPACAHEGVRGE